MGKEIGGSCKYNRSKISSPTLKKPVLLSSANHTSYTTNLTPTIMSHQLQHKDSTAIQNTVNTSNTDDIHSCVTPWKYNISVKDTYTPPRWYCEERIRVTRGCRCGLNTDILFSGCYTGVDIICI